MSRFYTLSEWCDRHNIEIRRDSDDWDAGFVFSYNNQDAYYDFYDVLDRPDVVRDQLRDIFR